MQGALISVYFLAILWNLAQNFQRFKIINETESLERYFQSKRSKGWTLFLDVFTSFYIVLWLSFTPILLARIPAFYKLLFVCYMIYSTYRFLQSFRRLNEVSENKNNDDELHQFEEELSIMDGLMDVRPVLSLEPMLLVILEAVCFCLSLFFFL